MAQKNKGYALALFSLASESSSADKIFVELQEIVDAFSQNPEYIELLSSPAISNEIKLSSLTSVVPSDYTEEIKAFLAILCKKGDLSEIFECFNEYQALYKEAFKISVANIVSAVELTDSELIALKKALEAKTGKNLTLKTTVDKGILGGVSVEIDGCVYDGSLKRRLDEIKKVIE